MSEEFLPDDLSDSDIKKLPEAEREYAMLDRQNTVQNLKNNTMVAETKQPDRHADVIRLANELKVNPEFVDRNYDTLKARPTPKGDDYYEQLVKKNPGLSKWLEDYNNVAVSKDDMDSLENIENSLQKKKDGRGFFDAVASGIYKVGSGLAKAPALMYQEAPGPDWLYEGASGAYLREEYKEKSGKIPESLYKNAVTSYLDKKAQEYAPNEMNMSVLTEAGQGNYSNAGKALAYQFAANLPNLVLLMTTRGAGLPILGAQAAGEKLAENAERGVGAGLAISNALVTGGIEAGVESIGGVGAVGFKESLKTIVGALGKESAKQVAKNAAKQIAKNAGAEGLEEVVTEGLISLMDVATVDDKAMDNILVRMGDAFIGGAVSGAGISAVGMTAERGLELFRKNAQVANSQDVYNQVGELAKGSKLAVRSPEKFKEMVDQVAEQNGAKDVYIPAQAMEEYFQGKDVSAVEIAQQLGVLKEYEQAKESGGDIKIPLSDMIQKLGPTEHYAGLSGDVKFSPDEVTANELKAEKESIRIQLGQISQEALDKGYDYNKAAQEIGTKVEEQLKSLNNPNIPAKETAKIFTKFLATQAKNMQIDPGDLLARYGFSINGVEIIPKAETAAVETPVFDFAQTDESGNLILNEQVLIGLQGLIEQGEAGQRVAGPEGAVGIPSTFPEFFKNKGYKKKEVLSIIKKYQDGKELTDAQKETLKDLYDGAVEGINNRELFQKDARLKRAEEAGFDTSKVFYHGSPKTFEKFMPSIGGQSGSGVYLTPVKSEAVNYGENIYEVYTKVRKSADLTSYESTLKIAKEIGVDSKLRDPEVSSMYSTNYQELKNAFRQAVPGGRDLIGTDADYALQNKLLEAGYDSIDFVFNDGEQVRMMFDPKNIKSVGADFNEFESGNIYAQTSLGKIQFGKNTINIELFKDANHSTFIHELGHFYAEMLKDLSQDPNAPEIVKKDWQVMKDYLGASDDKITTDQHEVLARSFEAYLMEGKAPSSDLQKVFNRFKSWMTAIYKTIKGLDVQLSDDIRGVFDRMLVGDIAVDDAYNKMNYSKPMFMNFEGLGISDADKARYIAIQEEARLATEEKVQAQVIEDYKKTLTATYKNKYNEVKTQVTDALKVLPQYKAYEHLRYNKDTDGKDLGEQNKVKFNKQELVEKFGKEYVQEKLKGMYVGDGTGMPMDAVAQVYGAKSGIELVKILGDMIPVKQEIENRTQEIMADEFPGYTNTLNEDWDFVNEAIYEAHNDKRVKQLEFEMTMLADGGLKTVQKAIKQVTKRPPNSKLVKEAAIKQVAQVKYKDLNPNAYRLKEREYAKKAGEALAQGDFEAAFENKRKELLNFYLFKAAQDAKTELKKSQENFKKLFGKDEDISKTRDMDLVSAARTLVSAYGLGKLEGDPRQYLTQMEKYEPAVYAEMANLISESYNSAVNFNEATINQLFTLNDNVSAIWDLAKSRRQIEIDGKKMNSETIRAELVAQLQNVIEPGNKKLYDQTIDKWGKYNRMWLGFKASLKRVEHWAEAVDTKFGGPFRSYIFQPISDAVAQYRLKKQDVVEKYQKILDKYKSNLTPEPIQADELRFIFKNKAELIMAILHTGNDSNKQKLLVGYGWAQFNDAGLLDTSKWDTFINRMTSGTNPVLRKEDFDFAQEVWDLMESLKPDAQKAHKNMYGFYFNEITAKSFNTKYGEYRGGYIPAKVDIFEVEDGAIRAERESFENNNNGFMFPTTGKGFTKGRVENYMKKLSLDVNLLGSHIDSVLRFSYIEPRVKEVARVVTDEAFRKELAKLDPEIGTGILIPWLQRAAQQKVVIPSQDKAMKGVDAVAGFLRKNVARTIMFLNATNALQQVTGFAVANQKVDAKYMRNAFAEYMTNRSGLVDDIMEKSDWMKSTQGSNIYELNQAIKEIIVNPSTFEKVDDFFGRHTYVLQTATQNMVNTVVWSGAYSQAIAQNMTENEAVKFADSVVRTTQGTNNPEDVAAFEAGSATKMLFTQFAGYFNMLANLSASEFKKIERSIGLKKGAGKAFMLYWTVLAVPAFLAQMVTIAASGKLDSDDDEKYIDDMLMAFFGSQFKTVTAMLPFAGQALNSAWGTFMTKEKFDDKFNLSPVISLVEQSAQAAGGVYNDIVEKGEVSKKTVKDSLQFISVFTGIPTGPISRPTGYLMDVQAGKAQPTGPIDFTRGLITGKSGN